MTSAPVGYAASVPADTSARRPRRSADEVRRAILEVARQLFDENGYQATTTAEICKRAHASERLIYDHFDNKAGLFNAAVIAPFADVVASYVDGWINDAQESTPDQRVGYLVSGLYELARTHRRALLTALVENVDGTSGQQRVLDQLAATFQRTLTIPPTAEYQGLDMPALLFAVIGMVLGAAMLDDLICPSGTPRPSRQRIIDEMRKTLLDGMRHRT
jgi:AcrR family transcriptional regulator